MAAAGAGAAACADDIVIIADSADHLQQGMHVMSEHARRWRWRVRFNDSMCAVMVSGKREHTGRAWWLGGERVEEEEEEEEEEYKYLGGMVHESGRWHRAAAASATRQCSQGRAVVRRGAQPRPSNRNR